MDLALVATYDDCSSHLESNDLADVVLRHLTKRDRLALKHARTRGLAGRRVRREIETPCV